MKNKIFKRTITALTAAALISPTSCIEPREAFAIKDNILYLLFGSALLGSYAAVDGSPAFPYILHAWRSSPDVF